jgi:hypothetical protein
MVVSFPARMAALAESSGTIEIYGPHRSIASTRRAVWPGLLDAISVPGESASRPFAVDRQRWAER